MPLSAKEKKRRKIEGHVRAIVSIIAEDEESLVQQQLLDLENTPERVSRMLVNETLSYPDPPRLHITPIQRGHGDIIAVGPVPFSSTCAHHLMPVVGTASVAYLANERVIGLSKIPRIVKGFSRRLQLQERLTRQILWHLVKHLEPRAALVVLTAKHGCMTCRGVETPGTNTTTSALYPHMAWQVEDVVSHGGDSSVPPRILDELYRAIDRCSDDT